MNHPRPGKVGAVAAILVAFAPALAAAEHRPFVYFGTQEGLSQLVAQTLHEDAQGNIWVGTEGGLHVLRGQAFVEVPVDRQLGRSIETIMTAPNGRLWIGTQDGLYLGRPNFVWRRFDQRQGLEVRQIRSLHVGPEGLWVGTAAGLYRESSGRFERVTEVASTQISVIARDKAGRRWVGSESGLYINQNEQWRRISKDPVLGIAASPDGKGVWVTFKGRLEFREPDRVHRTIPLAGSAWTGTTRQITIDQHGVVWAGTDEGALEIDGPRERLWGPVNDQPIRFVSSILEDREGGLWFAGTGGVVNLPDRSFVTFGSDDGLPSNNTRPILRAEDGTLFVGTVGGLAYRKDGAFRAFDNLKASVYALAKAKDGGVWVGSAEGLFRWTPSQGLRRDETWQRRGLIASLGVHPDGSLWVGGYNEVGLVHRTKDGDETIEVPGQTFLFPRLLVASDGRVWVSGSNGLSVYDGDRWTTYGMKDGLARDDPYFIAEDPLGRIWFGYYGPNGVTRFDGTSFRTFTEADGLSSNRVFSIGADATGNMWFGTAQGVDRFDGKRFVNFQPNDGYPSSESNAGGFLLDHDGSLWLSTMNGLAHHQPDHTPDPIAPPDVRLTALRAGGSTLTASAIIEGSQPDLTAAYVLQARFRPEHIDVRYRVKGLFETWTTAADGKIMVARLPSGKYVFELETRRRPGSWHNVARTAFTVRAPVWARAWIWVVILLPLLLLSWVLMRFRLKRSTVMNARLRRMVDERTQALTAASREAEAARDAAEQASRAKSAFLANMSHEIRTPLNAVIGTTALLMETPLNQEQAELATTAQRSSEALLQLVDEILDFSRIEAGRLDLNCGPLHLPRLAVDTLRQIAPKALGKRLSLAFYIDPRVHEVVVGDEARLRQVLLNLIVNAVNFTTVGEVGVEIVCEGDHETRLTVRDTGIGIPRDAQADLFDPFTQVDASASRRHGGTGLGLAISQRLVCAMGGRINVESAPGDGTSFSVILPLPPAPNDAPGGYPLDSEQTEPTDPATMREALAGKRVAVFAPGPVTRRAMRTWLTDWGAEPVVHERMSGGPVAAAKDIDAVVLVTNGWSAPVDLDEVLNEAASRRRQLVFVGPSPARHSVRALSEPITPERLFRALAEATRKGDAATPTHPTRTVPVRNGRNIAHSQPLSILVVDDNRVNREVATRMLQRLGYADVRCAEDGEAALQEVLRAQPDVVFMDVQMPGLDGLETTRRLRKLPVEHQPRIVALTASVLEEARQACTRAGMDDFVAKPVQISALTAALALCQPARLKTK